MSECRLRIRNEQFKNRRNPQHNRRGGRGGRKGKSNWKRNDNNPGGRPNGNGNNDQNFGKPRGFFTKYRSMSANTTNQETFLDCGANDHFVASKSVFNNYKTIEPIVVETSAGTGRIIGEGYVTFPFENEDVTILCKHVPSFKENLIGLSKFVLGHECNFDQTGCTIVSRTTKKTHRINVSNGLYPLPSPKPINVAQVMFTQSQSNRSWHQILGHVGVERMVKASQQLSGIPQLSRKDFNDHQCTACIESKSKRSPISVPAKRHTNKLELTHTDMSGKISITSLGKAQYFIVFLDDATAMSAVYFISNKSQFLDCLKAYKAFVENETKAKMLALRMDNAGEQTSNAVRTFIQENGMKYEYSPPYAAQSNGSSERLIQELWSMARTMLFDSNLDLKLWAEAISHSNWLRNRLPASRVDMKIPYSFWFGKKADVSSLIAFGTKGHAFQYRPSTAPGKKFLPRTLFGLFVGMESENTLFRIYIPSIDEVKVCRKDDFHILKEGTKLPSFDQLTQDIARKQQIQEVEQVEDEEPASEVLRHSYFTHYSQIPLAFKTKTKDPRIPATFQEACKIPNWAESIDREYNALVDRETWDYAPEEDYPNPLPYIWDFRLKGTGGSLADLIYKSRCCLRGDKQIEYRDFDPASLYAPVVKHETIRMFFTKVAAEDLEAEGADVDNAYLYGSMDRPIIMKQPTDSTGIPKRPGYVVILKKSIYGAKQAGEIWGSVIHEKFINWGFEPSSQDARLYFKRNGSKYMMLIVVVDDMAFASNDGGMMTEFKQKLRETFKVKLLGQLKSFIGWEITRTASGITICQQKYILKILELQNMENVKPVSTPLPLNADITSRKSDEQPLSKPDHERYRSLIGSISYLAICSRPDISFAISVLSRQLHDPAHRHLVLAKRVLRYISGTTDKSIFFPANSTAHPLTAYCDSDWGGCHETRRSTTGIIIKVNNAPIYWSSKRQTLVTLSSSEAEYVALSSCAKQVIWLRRLFYEMRTNKAITDEPKLPATVINTDSSSGLSLATKQVVSERNKHIDIKIHHVKDLIRDNIIIVNLIRTYEQPADLLTKIVSYFVLQKLLVLLNM